MEALPENTTLIDTGLLDYLMKRDDWLACVEEAGFAYNWEGYDKALALYTGVSLTQEEEETTRVERVEASPISDPLPTTGIKSLSSQYDGLDKKSFEKFSKKELVAILTKLVDQVSFDSVKDETGWPFTAVDSDKVADILRQRVC